MNFIPCQISPLYKVRVREDRYAEFATAYWFSNIEDKDLYLQQCKADGWVRD